MSTQYTVYNINTNEMDYSNVHIDFGPHSIYTYSKEFDSTEMIKMKPELTEIMFNKIGPTNNDGILINENIYNTFDYTGIKHDDNNFISVAKNPKFLFKYDCNINGFDFKLCNRINIKFIVKSEIGNSKNYQLYTHKV